MSSRRAVFAVLLAVVAGLTGGTGPAAAQEACGSGGGLTGTVMIDSPADGAVVSGVVEVRGTATSGLPLGELDRVDVILGGRTETETYAGQSPLRFSVSIDTSNMAPGEKSLIVVACGTSVAGLLARGAAEIAVEVEAPRAGTTTTVAQPTTTAGRQGGSAAAGSATTTSVASSAAAAAIAAGGTTTTVSSGPTTTADQSEARAPAAARPEPVRPRA
ncbi:MAG: hypothetical protein M3144_11735, partial [Actinomycetota bacterium]|nr:hypothetical protein [Actinomycetota bacterium]